MIMEGTKYVQNFNNRFCEETTLPLWIIFIAIWLWIVYTIPSRLTVETPPSLDFGGNILILSVYISKSIEFNNVNVIYTLEFI